MDGVGETSTTYATTQNIDDTISWIGVQKAPWMAVVAFNAGHAPFHAPPAGLYGGDLGGINCGAPASRRACYQKMIEAMDTEIGRLLRSFDRKETWILFILLR